MRRFLFGFCACSLGLAVVGAVTMHAGQASQAGSQGPAPNRASSTRNTAASTLEQYDAVLKQYCITCHNDRLQAGGLALSRLDLSALDRNGDVWEKVLAKLERRMMPPVGSPRPDEATYRAFTSWLATSVDAAAKARPNPGRPSLHRLNRAEYANAIRDLLSLDIDVAALLPPDDSTHGFDNIADALGVSPLLVESYVVAAGKVSRLAVGNPTLAPGSEAFWLPPDEVQDYHKDGLPFGTRGGLKVRRHFPLDGEYEIQIRLARNVSEIIKGLYEPGHEVELAIDGERVKLFTVDGGSHMYKYESFDSATPALTADDHLNVRIPVRAGPHEIAATFPARTSALTDGLTRQLVRPLGDTRGLPEVSRVIIKGAFNVVGAQETPSRRRIFTCQGGGDAEAQCAKNIIRQLAHRAYRGLVTDADIDDVWGFYATARKTGGFDAGIEAALASILASPKFIFRFEFDPNGIKPGTAYRISDLELASRLSFFLWSSIPDDQLLDLAERGKLKDPAIFEQQVRRMLADARVRVLVDNFAGQWLYLRNVESARPDRVDFPNFDNNLRQAFRRETELLFESIMRENRSVLDLMNADYTFVNERLARHYGIPGVRGSHFRRVQVSDENRRGILGHGSILMVTSYPNRTSPVTRGKWVLQNLLGAPPPPAPADVPDLEEAKNDGQVLSMRERMAQHRANPVCASCHKVMDPIGFGLEKFDAVGAWRSDEGGKPIDASGTLPNGVAFDGPAQLRQGLMQHPEVFVSTMVGKLLTYAIGRGLESYDGPAVRAITRGAAPTNYAFSSLILGIVKSMPFQMRWSGEELRAAATPIANR